MGPESIKSLLLKVSADIDGLLGTAVQTDRSGSLNGGPIYDRKETSLA